MTQPSIVQPRLLSRLNERMVLKAIQSNGPSTRAEVTDQIGVTFATVAKAVSSLVDAQLLEEYDEASVGRGRPAKRLRLAVNHSQVIGVSIEVDEIEVSAAGLDGETRGETKKIPTPKTYREVLAAIQQSIEDLAGKESPKVLGIGVSVAAQVDEKTGTVAVAANMPHLSGKPLANDLSEATGYPCSVVRDTHAICVAERLRGNARGLDNFLLLHFGVGIGMGVMLNGQLFFGQHGFAGELGHMTVVPGGEVCHCGRRGCLETVASEWRLLSRLSEQHGHSVHTEDVARLFTEGDPVVKKEVRRVCKYLALGVSHAIHLFNPGRVIVYSRLFDACPELLDLVVKNVEKVTLGLQYDGCEFVRACTTANEGSTAHIIEQLVDSLGPRLTHSRDLSI